jgi:hypothetical protein
MYRRSSGKAPVAALQLARDRDARLRLAHGVPFGRL